jgi:hypothetical protein
MFGILGLGPAEMICIFFTVTLAAAVVVAAVVLSNRRAPGRAGEGPGDPLRRIKRDYETLTDRERRELLDFIEADLRRPGAPGAVPPPPGGPSEGYTA